MWTRHHLDKDQTIYWQIAEMDYFMDNQASDCIFAAKRTIGALNFRIPEVSHKESLIQNSLPKIIFEKFDFFHIKPAMPGRPIMFKPTNEINILSGQSRWLFIPVPVSINIFIGYVQNQMGLIHEELSVLLSGAWHGELDSGIIAYSIERDAYLYPDEIQFKEYEVICPFNIKNDSDSILKIDSLLINSEHLKIFIREKKLFTNEIWMKYEGSTKPSFVQFGKAAPGIAKDAELIRNEAISPTENLLKRKLIYLRSGIN